MSRPSNDVSTASPTRDENRLLAALPGEEYQRLLPRLEMVHLEVHQTIYPVGGAIPHVYFPCSGAVSLLSTMEDGTSVEAASVGREGMVGLPVFLEYDPSPYEVVCQIPGAAMRLRAEVFKEVIKEQAALRRILHRYTLALMHQIARTAACNGLHPVSQRLARWLLMCEDRVGAAQFPLTHEYLARMLGVRRASVTVAARALQQAGVIRYTRGVVTILDRSGLEEASCEDYWRTREEYERLLG